MSAMMLWEAAKIVLDKINLDAEYVPVDIDWEFWRKEANPLPERTKEITDCENATGNQPLRQSAAM